MSLLALIAASCSKEKIKINPDNLLIGVWDFSRSDTDINIFSRSYHFAQAHCYEFNADGTLTERNYSGWCATPPVSYSDYNGTWSVVNDTLIEITVAYWGGMTHYKLNIVSVSVDSLKMIHM